MSVSEVLATLKEKMNASPEGITSLNTIYQFNLSGNEEGIYQIKFADGQVEVVEEASFEPKCTMNLSDNNFLKLVEGNLNPTMAFMAGKLKIKGDIALALKLQAVLKEYQ